MMYNSRLNILLHTALANSVVYNSTCFLKTKRITVSTPVSVGRVNVCVAA